MADTIKVVVLRNYRKRDKDGGMAIVSAGTILDEDRSLAVELITANKARQATPADEAVNEPAEPRPARRARGTKEGADDVE